MKVVVYPVGPLPIRIRLMDSEADRLEEALLIAARSDEISSETAAFVTELQDKLTEVRG